MPRIPVREKRGRQNVALGGTGRQPRRRPHPLDIEDDRGHLRVVAEPDELAHERDAGSRGRGHRPGPGPASAQRHPQRGDLVLGLHDGEGGLAGLRIHAVLAQIVDEGLAQRRRRRDRIPGDDGHPGHHAADGRRRVALDENAPAVRVHRLDEVRIPFFQVLVGEGEACIESFPVEGDDLGLAAELSPERGLHLVEVHPEQTRQHPVVQHVAHAAPQLDVARHLPEERVERDRVEHEIVAQRREIERLVVDDHRSRRQAEHVLPGGLRIHRDEDVDLLLAGDVSLPVGPDGEPGGQTGDVGRKQVLPRNGDTHLKDGAQQHEVRRLASGTVDGRDLDAEIVDDGIDRRRGGTCFDYDLVRGHSDSSGR